MNFNKQQLKAIEHKYGACAVIASAGSGKTTVLIERIHNLIKNGVKQEDILAISFTNPIAQELKEKLIEQNLEFVNSGTFHSIARNILKQNGINVSLDVIDKDEKKIEQAFFTVNNKLKRSQLIELKQYIDYQKVFMKTYNSDFEFKECSIEEKEIRKYFKAYEDYKYKNGLYDYTDWLLMCYKIIKEQPPYYKYILVDEHQDNNYLRNMLIKELAKHGNIFCVGDYRQSIYAFNGAVPEMFMKFDEDWNNTKIINIDRNYRSCKNIVENANNFSKLYYGEYKYFSNSIPHNNQYGNITIDTYYLKEDEASDVSEKIESLIKSGENPNDIAVLYRFNSHSDLIEKELKDKRIKYVISKKKSFFDRKEIKLVVSYLRLINDIKDNMAFETVFNMRNYPIMYIKTNDFIKVKQIAYQKGISFYDSFTKYKLYSGYNTLESVADFKKTINRIINNRKKGQSIGDIIDDIVKSFRINDYIEETYSPNEAEDRKESLLTFKSFVKNDNLDKFLSFVLGEDDFRKTKEKEGIRLMTVHASKGLEFKHVFLISVEDDKFPCYRSPIIEEANLFYVAVTRAKENLHISQIGEDNRFITEYFR